MVFRVDGPILLAENDTEYRMSDLFLRVLQTLDDDPIPKSLVMVGILTEQVVPTEGEQQQYIRLTTESIDEAPAASVSSETVRGILWLLSQVRESLEADRKRLIGELITKTGLNSPSSEQQNRSQRELAKIENPKRSDHPQDESTPSESKVTCEFCRSSLESERELVSHLIRCADRPSDAYFECENCGNKFISEYALMQHTGTCCSKTEANRENRDDRRREYECNNCGRQFDKRPQWVQHRSSCPSSGVRTQIDHAVDERLAGRNLTGYVDYFDQEEGYGFILTGGLNPRRGPASDGLASVFFHASRYPDNTPEEGDRLRFDAEETDQGYRAIEITYDYRTGPKQLNSIFASERQRWGK